MAKIKRSGATLNHPIPPLPACTAKKYCMFTRLCPGYAHKITSPPAFKICEQPPTPTFAAGLSFHDGSSDRFRPDHLPLRLESGEVVTARSRIQRDQTLEKTGLFPKLNRMTHPPHSVKVETKVVQ